MVHPCLVVCGKWKCDVAGEWEFLLDKGRLPRNVLIDENINISGICNILVAEFGDPDFMSNHLNLSYLVPSLGDSRDERMTPPVFLETTESSTSFMRRFSEDRGTTLFVTFPDNPLSESENTGHSTATAQQRSHGQETTTPLPDPFMTPLMTRESTVEQARDDVEPYVPECIVTERASIDVEGTLQLHLNNERHATTQPCFHNPQVVNPVSHPFMTPVSDPFRTPTTTRESNVVQARGDVEPYVPESIFNNEGHATRQPYIPTQHTATPVVDPFSTPLRNFQGSYVPEAPRFDLNNEEHPTRRPDIHSQQAITPVVDPYRTPLRNVQGSYIPEAPSFDLNEVWIDEEDLDVHFLLKEVEAIEEVIRTSEKRKGKRPSFVNLVEVEPDDEVIRTSQKSQGKRLCLEDVVELESEDEDGNCDADDSDVRSRGYDKEFWGAFLDEEYGGSNAPDIMHNATDESEERIVDANSGLHVVGDGGSTSQSGFHSQQPAGNEIFEPDIPPVFDDTTCAFPDIPDLDKEDEDICVGKTYANKSDCQIALAIYAIKNMFYFKQTRTTKEFFVATCADPQCSWRVSAHKMSDSCYYKIKKALLVHSCSIDTRSKYNKKATYRVIASVLKPKFNSNETKPKPRDLQQLALEQLRVSASYAKCWKVREAGNQELRGSDEESFAKLSEYLYILKFSNPGTIADIETVTDLGSGMERFLYVFLAFGASIVGFRHVRRVIVIDGTHLHGKYKGVLLTASGQDANFQVFPLAFAVVDSEDDNSWTWFLTKIKENIIADSPTVTIISDRHSSIYTAKKAVFPLARHGACVVHLSRNVSGHYKTKGIGKLVIRAACAYRVKEFNDAYEEIEKRSKGAKKYLDEIGLAHWARAYFNGDRYNMMTSNVAESLNNALKKGRDSPITELLMFIQSMLSRWFFERRKKAEMHRGFITPEVDKLMTKHLGWAKGCTIEPISKSMYHVHGKFGGKYKVDLSAKRCTCKRYDILQIPCGHALLVADVNKLSCERLAGNWYRSSEWAMTYRGIIQPPEDARDMEIPQDVRARVLLPPRTRRPPGRPKGKRQSSFGEISGKKSIRKCGRCKGFGHNKTSCKHPI